jgi:hypothetical protein
MTIARNISPRIRRGVNMTPEIQGKLQGNPHGNPQGKPQGKPIIRTKPEKIAAQMNKAKMMPITGDPSLKGP